MNGRYQSQYGPFCRVSVSHVREYYKCREWVVRQYAESTQINLAQTNGTYWNRLIFLKVNIIIWIRKNQQFTEKFTEIFWPPYE